MMAKIFFADNHMQKEKKTPENTQEVSKNLEKPYKIRELWAPSPSTFGVEPYQEVHQHWSLLFKTGVQTYRAEWCLRDFFQMSFR